MTETTRGSELQHLVTPVQRPSAVAYTLLQAYGDEALPMVRRAADGSPFWTAVLELVERAVLAGGGRRAA